MKMTFPRLASCRRALAGLAAVFLWTALPAGVQAQNEPSPQDPNTTLGAKHGDWQVVCQKVAENQELCGNVHEVMTKEGKLALWAAFGYFQPDSEPVMILRVPYDITDPPTGFRVGNGVQLSVDGTGQLTVPVEICAPGGCQLGLLLEPDLVTALKGGNKLNVAVPMASGQTATINVSLKGFTAAYDALKKPQ